MSFLLKVKLLPWTLTTRWLVKTFILLVKFSRFVKLLQKNSVQHTAPEDAVAAVVAAAMAVVTVVAEMAAVATKKQVQDVAVVADVTKSVFFKK